MVIIAKFPLVFDRTGCSSAILQLFWFDPSQTLPNDDSCRGGDPNAQSVTLLTDGDGPKVRRFMVPPCVRVAYAAAA